MTEFFPIIILIIIVIIGFKVSKKNYKNRATYINNNLLEYCCEIIKEYDKIPLDKQHEFKQTLTPKELELINRLIFKDDNFGRNLNILQTQMFTLEAIMQKLRNFQSETSIT